MSIILCVYIYRICAYIYMYCFFKRHCILFIFQDKLTLILFSERSELHSDVICIYFSL